MTSDRILLAVISVLLAVLGFMLQRELTQIDSRIDRITDYVLHAQPPQPAAH